MALLDFFDPNYWQQDQHQYRIYVDDYANEYALVDEIDYSYLVQWRWKLKKSRTWANTKKPKFYLARSEQETLGPEVIEDGKRIRHRITRTLFLHTVVMQRTGKPKPNTNSRIIVDHADGNSLDCRRHNLRYATQAFNNKNINGCHEYTLIEEFIQC